MYKQLAKSLIFYLISALGISLTIKANIGVSSFNALNVAVSDVTQIKVGTVTTGINFFFLSMCVFLDKQRTIKKYVLMIVSLICFGNVVNIILYSILANVHITIYPLQILTFILGTIIGGIGTGRVLYYGTLKFPIETLCQLLEAKTKLSFSFYRYSIDVVSVILSLGLSFYYHLPLYVREGTIISLFLLSSVIHWANSNFQKH
ncbi:hypothetical protein GMA11_05675 [Granulicatella sp. zg-ZJ]|uniref:YitT family protein n=1 Tax=Granulicatella sp. zg-ZJ TaxID=2678504 RepID=UPI0013D2B299|nr:YitT family protein [Granulicatella sp. zg-ZJ]MBS4750609.1 YitT family protein [Carnobacteriaceae bacterium zg-ZUI78]NEW62878.1 hypothetical protein [Granulicatella sp. zg-ZJ]